MNKKEYYEKLKDPRWQKKRNKILERDEYTCQICYDSEATLHVHHMIYNDCDPWDIPEDCLVTLCESCHEQESQEKSKATKELIKQFNKRFHSWELLKIAKGLSYLKMLQAPEIVASAIEFMFACPKMNQLILDKFWENVARVREEIKNAKKI